MLRAVLLGVLALSVVGCKSHDDATKSQVGVAAGKVVETSGTVSVHHGDDVKPLAKGDSIDGDDVVETGADGHVLIELAHNNATWDLGPNKKTKVRDSLAWGLAKQDKAAKAVEQDSAAAGRHAERNAADTTVSAGAPPAAEPTPAVEDRADKDVKIEPKHAESEKKAAPPAPPAVQPPVAIAAPQQAENAPAPPPPPPAPPKTATTRSMSPKGVIGGAAPGGGRPSDGVAASVDAPSGGEGDGKGSASEAANVAVRAKNAELRACLHGDPIQFVVKIGADGKATLTFRKATPAEQACVKHVIDTIHFAKVAAQTAFQLRP